MFPQKWILKKNHESDNAVITPEKVIDDVGGNSKDMKENRICSFLQRGDAGEKIREFITFFPLAKTYLKDIIATISNDDALAQNEKCLSLAFCKVIENALNSKLSDEQVEGIVLSRQNIKDKIIEQYLGELVANSPPKVIDSRGVVSINKPTQPASFEDANKLAIILLKQNSEGENLW